MRTITVKGTGNVSARPDYIILSLNIEVLSETYDRAMSEAAERIERLQGAAVRVDQQLFADSCRVFHGERNAEFWLRPTIRNRRNDLCKLFAVKVKGKF